ncbi:AMP deaminase 2 [Strongyloides ratti]|uniref:AMP deaminase n=1 Tax=Strongyloides ratti TaxID=34506 RepID=A0A090LC53_STRRB|nr:AMP deaminase 2 [Strongyloides ratti]CEF67347.1 AMP deaminase 2 [Strongyloides ratti]
MSKKLSLTSIDKTNIILDKKLNNFEGSDKEQQKKRNEEFLNIEVQRLFPAVQHDDNIPLHYIIEALNLRKEYMARIGCTFPITTNNFLENNHEENLNNSVKKIYLPDKTSFHPPEPDPDHWGLKKPLPKYNETFTFKREFGIVRIYYKNNYAKQFEKSYLSKQKFLKDYDRLLQIVENGPLKSFCFRRLLYLKNKFQLYQLHNDQIELHEQKSAPHRDFYNIRKVDTHIHATSSMNQKHLLRFIKKKFKKDRDTYVLEKDGKKLTMGDVFKNLDIEPYDLNVDMLDCHADKHTFHRFDSFNNKYNPIGETVLRNIFLKANNYVGGKYFAELLKEVYKDLEDSKYQHAEPRISIQGCKKDDWSNLASWAIKHDVWSPNAKLLIQIPRVYDAFKSYNMIQNFGQLLDNIFTPLFEVTNDPSIDPILFRFLLQVTGFDCVDDESKHEYSKFDKFINEPDEYTDSENPPYTFYMFYFYANISMLNSFRSYRGLNTFSLRPHCGEAGAVSHLISGFLTSESISHGLLLRKSTVLQYLFYLTQMGVAMSPLSNNLLFVPYNRNPFPEFFMQGLNVSLSTDDPLMFHFTKEPLMEEYSIAVQVWKLSSIDMCELARNSIYQSGFDEKVKIHWLGVNYKREGVADMKL